MLGGLQVEYFYGVGRKSAEYFWCCEFERVWRTRTPRPLHFLTFLDGDKLSNNEN